MIANSQHITSKSYQTLKYILIVIFSIAILNCGSSSSGTTVPNGEPDPNPNPNPNPDPDPRPDPINYKFQNGVVEGVNFETNSGKTGTISSDKVFTPNIGDEKITFKIKDLIIGEINIKDINADKMLLVSDIVGVERDDTVNKDVLKMLRVLHSLDRDKNPLNGIFIDDTTKNKLVGLSEGKTKIIENTIVELKALMVKAGKKLVVEKKARDYYKENVLKPLKITPKFNPFTLEVNILPTDKIFTFKASTGFTYDYTVDWGDSSDIETGITGEKLHTYANAGTYTIKVSGNFPLLNLSDANRAKIVEVLAWGDIEWKSFVEAFKKVDAGFHTTDTPDLSGVTHMRGAFSSSTISDIDFINDWDVSNVVNMNSIFNSASNFNGNVSSWDVSNVVNMNSMFANTTSFTQDITGWNVSSAQDMTGMFIASLFNQDISDWNVSSVTNMNNMFFGARSFNRDLSGWNVSNVTKMSGMFQRASSFNQDISRWNVSSVTSMANMFNNATSFNQNLSSWSVGKVKNHSAFAFEWGGVDGNIPPKFR